MVEQAQENEGGSVAIPLAVGVAGGVGTKMLYNKAANQLAADALSGKEGVKEGLRAAAETALEAGGGQLINTHKSAKVLSNPADIETINRMTVKAAGGKDAKGFDLQFYSAKHKGRYAQLHVDSLSGEASELLKDGQKFTTLTGDTLKKLTAGGENSWVVKTAIKAEKDALTTLKKSEVWKEAGGGIKAALSHMGGGSKAAIAATTIAAVGGLGYGVKNMFSSAPSHTTRVEAERTASQGQETTRA